MEKTLEDIEQEFALIVERMNFDSCQGNHPYGMPCSVQVVARLQVTHLGEAPRKVCQTTVNYVSALIHSDMSHCIGCLRPSRDCWHLMPL